MFRFFSKLFSKKAPLETVEAATPSRFRAFIARAIAKLRFWFYLVLCLTLLTASGVYTYAYIYKITKNAVESAQAVMVNVVTDEIFIGSLYKDTTTPEPAPEKAPSKEEMKANSGTDTNIEAPKVEAPTLTEAQKNRAKSLGPEDTTKAKIALIITGLGLSKKQTLEVLEADHHITLGFSPYASDVGGWINQAVDKGFEVMLQLPMQPADYQINDPGPYAMLQNLSAAENLDRLNTLISRSNKIMGFYSQPSEIFSCSKSDVTPIIERLSKDKFVFLYGNSQNQPEIQTLCQSNGLECLYVDYCANDDLNEKKIFAKLQQLEAEAIKTGYSIGYLNGYPVTLKALKRWLSGLDTNKVALTPVSTILEYAPHGEALDSAKKDK